MVGVKKKGRFKMVCNIHPYERVVRAGIGLGLMSLAFWGPQNYWFVLAGIVPFLTGVTGYCPPYHMLGINTNSKKKKEN
jgi:hypothetical protein